ncbi:MAG: copper oxidase (laccase) domain-containing protein [Candidatus Poriferisodalaceae bacterium]
MSLTLRRLIGDHRIAITMSDRSDGDMAPASDGVDVRRRTLLGSARRWSWMRQVHGSTVHLVGPEHEQCLGLEGDGLVCSVGPDMGVLSIQTADCAPVVIHGVAEVAVVHAGWKGLEADVVGVAVESIRNAGDSARLRAVLGPCIRVDQYEFGAEDLARLVDQFGPAVAGTTAWGTPGLDMKAAVVSSLKRHGVSIGFDVNRCTAADTRYFSHRARGDRERMTTAVRWDGDR